MELKANSKKLQACRFPIIKSLDKGSLLKTVLYCKAIRFRAHGLNFSDNDISYLIDVLAYFLFHLGFPLDLQSINKEKIAWMDL